MFWRSTVLRELPRIERPFRRAKAKDLPDDDCVREPIREGNVWRDELARVESRREFLEDSGAGDGVEGAGVDAPQSELSMIEIQQIETDAAIAHGGNVDLTPAMAQRPQTAFEQRTAHAIEGQIGSLSTGNFFDSGGNVFCSRVV